VEKGEEDPSREEPELPQTEADMEKSLEQHGRDPPLRGEPGLDAGKERPVEPGDAHDDCGFALADGPEQLGAGQGGGQDHGNA
jgi:hypothetical protein